jgi:D-3-phosphoglycerate dehydrogenase / 2-oxoglutarate reductase
VEAAFTVVVTDHPWASIEAERAILAAVGAEMRFADEPGGADLDELARDADAILTCFGEVGPAVVRAARRLKVIGRYGIGVDNIAVEVATENGILVTNVPSYCQDEVTDHALAMILAFARQLVTFDRGVHAGDWSLKQLRAPVRRIRGQTLGIVGLGRIGHLLATKARALGFEVVAHDTEVAVHDRGAIEFLSLQDLARRADYVSLHVPLTESTRNLVDEAFLRQMKSSAILINTARGGIVDQDALVTALRKGWIAGAALDVFTPERIPKEHPLLALPNVITTPHVAYYSEESLIDLGRLAAESVASVLAGMKPAAIVNPEVLDLERWGYLRVASARITSDELGTDGGWVTPTGISESR